MTEKIKPGRGRYVLAALVLVVGWAIAGMGIVGVLTGVTENLQQVVVPGEHVFTFDQAGDYTIFYEHESVVGNQTFSTGDLNGINVAVTSLKTGESLSLDEPSTELTYSQGGRSGQSLAAFTIPEAGDYRLQAGYPEGQQANPVVLAVGSDEATNFAGPLVLLIGIGLGTSILALVLAIRTFQRRKRALRARDVASSEAGAATGSIDLAVL
ncbi:MAG TPA: hypothetical protein VHJ78_01125 [Actinomycetota bacterium]|nr:hypothetical protein [Actinomycetota bacterium]